MCLHKKENVISRPRTASGLGGHYRPLLHKVFTTSMFECVAYYRQMSSWLYASCTNNIVCFASLMYFGGLASLAEGALAAVMLAFTAPILMLILIPTKWSSLSVEVIMCEC